MKISKKIQDQVNKQITFEFYSSYLYLSMAAFFDAQNLTGFSHWLKKQAQEEIDHAMRLYKYLFERSGILELGALNKPTKDWETPLAVFENIYSHEKEITTAIHGLLELANSEKDHATVSFLKWFVDEQVEEEDNALGVLDKLKMAGDSKGALLYIDKVMGKRE